MCILRVNISFVDYCSIQTCGYRQRCVDHMRRQIPTSLCKCHPLLNACNNDSTSNNTDTILCGDNGVTYTRHCNLRKAECKSGTLISIKHSGSCDYEENDAGGENLEGYVALHNVSLSYKPNCMYMYTIVFTTNLKGDIPSYYVYICLV